MPVDVSVLTALEATTAIDAFNRTAEIPLSDGGLWTSQVETAHSTLNTDGAAVIVSAITTDCSAYRNNQNFGPDMGVMVTLSTETSGDNGVIGLYILLQGSGLGSGTPNGYRGEIRIRPSTDDEWRIQRVDAGVDTVISSGTFQEATSGDKFAVIRNSTSIELWWKSIGTGTWSFIVAATDATYTAAGKVGLHVNDVDINDSQTDDFKAQNTAAASSIIGAPSPPVTRVRLRQY